MSENLYLTIRAGRNVETARPVLASTEANAIRAAARGLVEALGLEERHAAAVLAIRDEDERDNGSLS